MKKDDLVYIGHMLDTARSATEKVQNVDRAAFDQNEILRLAVAHLIQTLGEAAARVSSEFRNVHGDVPWREVIGMRQKIVHDYMHVNYDIVWNVATRQLPPLIAQLETMVTD